MSKLSAAEIAERDAKITILLVQGVAYDSITKAIGCSKPTVVAIAERLKKVGYDAQGAAEKRDRFIKSVEDMGVAYMGMLTAQAELLSDTAYISKQTTTDVIAHSEFVGRQFERVIRLQRSTTAHHADALPERVEAEVVDAEPISDVA